MLGEPVTHRDMQAADPEFYKNLLQILKYSLDDLGLELTFSDETEVSVVRAGKLYAEEEYSVPSTVSAFVSNDINFIPHNSLRT